MFKKILTTDAAPILMHLLANPVQKIAELVATK
jgi:hypothetical protein